MIGIAAERQTAVSMMRSPLERGEAGAQLCVLYKQASQSCCSNVSQSGSDGDSLQV